MFFCKRSLLTILVIIVIILTFSACTEQQKNESSKVAITQNDEVKNDSSVVDANAENSKTKYINYIKSLAVHGGGSMLYVPNTTYGDLFDSKYFSWSEWEHDNARVEGKSINFVSISFNCATTNTNSEKIVFICADDCSDYDILNIYNKNGTTVRESAKEIVQWNDDEMRIWLYSRVAVMAFKWVDRALINKDIPEEYIAERNGDTAFQYLTNNDEKKENDKLTEEIDNTSSWNFKDFNTMPFSMDEFNNRTKDPNWYDNGVFSTYIKSEHPEGYWEYQASFDCNMMVNPYGYTGFQVYTHSCDEAQRIYTYLVPISPAGVLPEVYIFDETTETMKMVFGGGQ